MGFGSAPLVVGTLYCMYPFCSIGQHHAEGRGAGHRRPQGPRARAVQCEETFDANVKVLQAVVPRPQSTGPRDTYIVRRVCQGPPFARWRRRVREGGALPPTWDPPAVVVGDEEGNTFMGEWYCPQVTISSFWDAKKNTKKREEHSAMFRGWGRGANPKHFFFGFSDFATVKIAEDREERGLPAWANEEVEWEVPCELLFSLAHPLGRAVCKIFWDKGDLGDVRVPAHQHAEEVYQRGEHLRLREWSPDDVADYEERLRYFQGDHVFVGGEGVEGAEEEEGEEAEEEEVEEAEEEEVEKTKEEEGGGEKEEERQAPVDIEPELSIEVDIDTPPPPPAPRPKPSPKPPAKGAVRRKPQPAYKYGGKKELVESASHGTLREVPDVYYIPRRWVDPVALRVWGTCMPCFLRPSRTARCARACVRRVVRGMPRWSTYVPTSALCLRGSRGAQKCPRATVGCPRLSGRQSFQCGGTGIGGLRDLRCVSHALWRIGSREDITSPLRTSPESARAWSSRPLPRCGGMLPCWLHGGGTWRVGRASGPPASWAPCATR